MSTGHRILTDLGKAYGPGGLSKLDAPAASGTIRLKDTSLAYVVLSSAGTYKVENAPMGTQVTIFASANVTLTSEASAHIVSVDSGNHVQLIADSDSSWALAGGLTTAGFIDLPLVGWREVTSNDITNAAGNGGVLATDTTPTLEYVNGNTDSQIRMLWAAGNTDAVARQVTLPTDLDRTRPIVLNVRQVASGTSDLAKFEIDSFFDEGDTLVGDTAADAPTDTVSNTTITISAADIPSAATTLSIEFNPEAHASDSMTVYATWLTYTKKIA